MPHKIWNYLQGKKTFISAGIGALIGVAYFFHYLTGDQFQALSLVAGAFGLVGIRSAMNKFVLPTIVNQHIDLTNSGDPAQYPQTGTSSYGALTETQRL